MSGEKKMETNNPAESVATGLKEAETKFAEQDMASREGGVLSDSTSSLAPTGNAIGSMKGYSGSFTQLDTHGYSQADASQMGLQSDNTSMVYYLPGYNPYATGTVVGADVQCVGQQPHFSSSGYLHPPVSYGSEAVPYYSWQTTYVGDAPIGKASGFVNAKQGPGVAAFAMSKGINSAITNSNFPGRFSKSTYTQHNKPLNKMPQLGSDFSAGLLKRYHDVGKFSSFPNQKQDHFPHNEFMNYRSTRTWSGNDKFKLRDKSNRNRDFETASELTRGPRAYNRTVPSDSSDKKEGLGLAVHKDQCNVPDFQTLFDNAKFYIIKSYSEDDVHKCIKYDVWSSTPNGNKKLDAAFHDAEARASETSTKCPIFLFFSVNGSGQFVGLAEMTGKVDFDKNMHFWQLDKWNGFFPVKWHIIKDIPNNQLRHIILENNDNKPVTFTRDTQEVELKQGLEMLNIFKNYSAKTSLLDDFSFYEDRERTHDKKSNNPATLRMETYKDDDGFPKIAKTSEMKNEEGSTRARRNTNSASLINLTKNLSLNSRP
ncbi:YTH domain-containing protein [Cephalotus follicularis]|uniref:YTH domain-containing family protein n=1 Tax=Cephalotus follicularis TaxID=3775 RepID=A0A1Q3DD75_CEPFO|nr:YTH domain-containing protein [Cephalotus follicularis]